MSNGENSTGNVKGMAANGIGRLMKMENHLKCL